MRVKYEVMVNEFERVLKKYGFNEKNAKDAAQILHRILWPVCIPTV